MPDHPRRPAVDLSVAFLESVAAGVLPLVGSIACSVALLREKK